jgi:hypothetical protein
MQDYLHLPVDIAEVLEQARSHGASLVLAHQALTQLPPALLAAVLANARSRVCFRLSDQDAATIARGTKGTLEAADFTALGAFEVYASLMANGASTPYASGHTRPAPTATADVGALKSASRRTWGRQVDEVEASFAALVGLQPSEQSGPVGSRPRQPR